MITEKDNKPWFTTRFQAVQSRSKASEKTVYGEWVERSGDQLNGLYLKQANETSSLIIDDVQQNSFFVSLISIYLIRSLARFIGSIIRCSKAKQDAETLP